MSGKKAFISHSHVDDQYVAEFEQLIRGLGYVDVFCDSHSILPDEYFWPVIEQGIRDCDAFVVIISRASVSSKWVEQEVEYARSLGKNIIPVRIGDCCLPDLFDGRDVVELASVSTVDTKIATSRIMRHAPNELFGRQEWITELDSYWKKNELTNIFAIVAWGGVGKTSVVAHWIAEKLRNYRHAGIENYFDWSFYSQGTTAQNQAGADFFLDAALSFFGDTDPKGGDNWARGERLATLIKRSRTLLVLDGIEPMLFPVNHPSAGCFKDRGLQSLLTSLAFENQGLCVITSRESLSDLVAFSETTYRERILDQLSCDAAMALLRSFGVRGDRGDLATVWKNYGGHALSIQLIGRYLVDAHLGDVRRHAEIDLSEADAETPGRSAMKVLQAYESWLSSAGIHRQRDLAVLRLTGLFDRPAEPGCIAALRAAPAIEEITDGIVGLTDTQWNMALSHLVKLGLITVGGELDVTSGRASEDRMTGLSIDAHPLVREYFARQLRTEHTISFRLANQRLYAHLCENTREGENPDLIDLEPLYQAIVHGCNAGMYESARASVYRDRIVRGGEFYSTRQLGAISADLGAIACFFKETWTELHEGFSLDAQSWLYNEAAFRLRSLGRLRDALQPTLVAFRSYVEQEKWKSAARLANNISEIELLLGRLSDSVAHGEEAVKFSDLGDDPSLRIQFRACLGDALCQAGEITEAERYFNHATEIRAGVSNVQCRLGSIAGFRHSGMLLLECERFAWHHYIAGGRGDMILPGPMFSDRSTVLKQLYEEAELVKDVERKTESQSLLGSGLSSLVCARISLYQTLIESSNRKHISLKVDEINLAISRLRQAGSIEDIPHGLVTQAEIVAMEGTTKAFANSHRVFDQAWAIAEREPMPLFLVDIMLSRARIFGGWRAKGVGYIYPWKSAKNDLSLARGMVDRYGYKRRMNELSDAECQLVTAI